MSESISTIPTTSTEIEDWLQFAESVRSCGCNLLRRLPEFPQAILVTGCQRSGTTILSRVLTRSEGMVNYWFGQDDELDAALILSGIVPHHPRGRYCFQTTFLNECYPEYFQQVTNQKIIWVLRNPSSVIYSMLYNWKGYAFDELFAAVGVDQLTGLDKWRYRFLGSENVGRIKRGCAAYNGKISQLFDLAKKFSPRQLAIVDYDKLVTHKETVLPAIYNFVDLPYSESYADQIHTRSVRKAASLTGAESRHIRMISQPIYEQAKQLTTHQLGV